VGQRSGDKEGAAEAYLAGQVEILAKMLNNRSLADVKRTFLCVRDSLLYHTHFLRLCTIFHSGTQNSTDFFFLTTEIPETEITGVGRRGKISSLSCCRHAHPPWHRSF